MNSAEEWDEFVDEWDRRRRTVAHLLVCLVGYYHIYRSGNTVDRLIMSTDRYKKRGRQCNELMADFKTSKTTRERENEKWTPQMDDVLIEALTHEHDAGNRVNATFTTTAYENILKELFENLGKKFTKQQVKNRLKTIKKNFNECYDIFNGGISGFSWSPPTKMWNAEPKVWKMLIEEKPEAKKWTNTPIPNYEKLSKIFGKDRTTKLAAIATKERARNTAAETQNYEHGGEGRNIVGDNDQMATQEYVALESIMGLNGEHSSRTPPHEVDSEAPNSEAPSQSTTTSNSKKRKATSVLDEEKLNESIDRLALAMEMGNNILKERNEILKKSQPYVGKEAEVYSELMKLGLDQNTCIRGYGFLIDNPVKARAFFGCPIETRVQFLICQMRSAGVI